MIAPRWLLYFAPHQLILATVGLLALTSCTPPPAESGRDRAKLPPAVETAVAATGSLETAIEYTGTTAPIREVSLRAQTEGRLLNLAVNLGDPVRQGQVLGQVDSQLLLALVDQERAELAALESEVAQATAEVSDAKAQVEQARVELQQAQSDANRLQSLASQGAITAQSAEQSVTAARTAQQQLNSAQEQVRTRQQGVTAAQKRVTAQQATLNEVEAREAFAALSAPISGAVLQRTVEPGDLLRPGDEVLKLGDFSAVKVAVQVSELELGELRVGQSAQVKLDAFPNRVLRGQITRISPAADPTARLVPIEVTIANADGQIGSGLLARVQFQLAKSAEQIIVPEAALNIAESSDSALFVLADLQDNSGDNSGDSSGEAAKVTARSVTVGRTLNDKAEITSGLKAGEVFVIRSSKPLEDGQSVKLSILSETEAKPSSGG